MNIRIGNQTAFSAPPLLPFEFAVSSGFDAFEWFPDKKISGGWNEQDVQGETRSFIKNTALANDIRLSVHAPLPSGPFGIDLITIPEDTIRFACDIGAVLINIHLPPLIDADKYAYSVAKLSGDLAEYGMKLSLENSTGTCPEAFNDLFLKLRSKYASGLLNIGMCFDPGHANLYPGTRNDYLAYFDRLDPSVPVIHIHLHENYGDSDSHLTIFTGPAGNDPSGVKGLLERLMRRNYSGAMILEQWPQPEGLLVDARNRLLAMMPPEEKTGAESETDSLAKKIADADKRLPSWRKKLEWIYELITEKDFGNDPDRLAAVAVYLSFIGNGEVKCSEDGTHYRPSNHARISRRIYSHLAGVTTPDNVLIMRKIHPWLPSFNEPFLKAEPLTLIRDIAHRNDIPGELKKEIKVTLQNKLHRSAGPEDLATSAALLERITSPDAGYPAAFVEEFRRFHEELKDFFNACSLREMLQLIMKQHLTSEPDAIREFLEAGPENPLRTLDLLTGVRRAFFHAMSSADVAGGQRLLQADIKLEEYSFVLLSAIINDIEQISGAAKWETALQCLVLAIENLAMGGLSEEECEAIHSELKAWSADFDPGDRIHLLRLGATLDRGRRLAESYRDRILSLFPEKVEELGLALGVSAQARKFYVESDIRSYPVFQLSKLVSLLLKEIRTSAGLPPWDVIVPGTISGTIVYAALLTDLPEFAEGPLIAVAEKVEGEEEIPSPVKGIIIPHQTPHLSHLAVRARQKRTVFLVCEDPRLFEELKSSGGHFTLEAEAENVQLIHCAKDCGRETVDGRKQGKAALPDVSVSSAKSCLPLDEITAGTGGGKAYGARRLYEISKMKGAGFGAVGGLVIPFGAMEEAIASSPFIHEYRAVLGTLHKAPPGQFEENLRRLKEITLGCRIPDAMLFQIRRHFKSGTRMIVRSSANTEDSPELAGAGLHDSIADVKPAEAASAVAEVWSSLWNRGAAAELKKSGVPFESAHMAVLLQPLLIADFSFIMHTVNPANNNSNEITMEVAVGQGGVLASAEEPGMPYRIIYDKAAGNAKIQGLASFSRAVLPGLDGKLILKTIDYSQSKLSVDGGFCAALAVRIGRSGQFVERIMGRPQDIEGLVSGDAVYLVQSRPQQGI